MVNEKQCYKQFCKITDGKENEGYGEWKEWVLKQIESYDKKQLTNLEKRTKLKLKDIDVRCNLKQYTIMSYGISIIGLLLPIAVTLYYSSISDMVGIYSQAVPKDSISSYAQNMGDIITTGMGDVLRLCCIICSILLLVLVFEIWARKKIARMRYSWKIYYEELLEILEEKLLQMN